MDAPRPERQAQSIPWRIRSEARQIGPTYVDPVGVRDWTALSSIDAADRSNKAAPLTMSVTRDMSGVGSTRSVRFVPEGSHAAGGQDGPDHRCDWVASSEEVELR